MSLRDDINIPLVVTLGITTGLIVAVAIIGTQAGYNYASQSELARNYDDPNPDVQARLHFGQHVWAGQREALAAPASWAGADKQSVRIPINDAITAMANGKGKGPAAAIPPANGGGSNAGGGNGQAAPTSQPASH